MQGGHHDYTARVAANLRRSLEDLNPPIRLAAATTLFGQSAWVIEVDVPGKTLIYSPAQLDNGAEGIKEARLVAIRKALGEDISLPNRYKRTDPYARFTDIIAIDDEDE